MKRSHVDRTLSVLSLPAFALASGVGAGACSASDPELPADANPVVVAAAAPPPISGGTLTITSKGLAVAADSERDVVYVVDLGSKSVTTVALQSGDEPGRVVEDGQGRVHVALRRGGAVATIDLASNTVVDRTAVCSAPRGIAFDSAKNVVHVACGGGELVTLPAGGGAPVRSLRIADRDLRDVIVSGTNLYVTRLRTAEVLTLDANGSIINRDAPFGVPTATGLGASFAATVAWRTIGTAAGGLAMLHQLSANSTVKISEPGGYGTSAPSGPSEGCSGEIVQTAVATFYGGKNAAPGLPQTALTNASVAVDLADDGVGNLAIASAGSDQLFVVNQAEATSGQPCASPAALKLPGQPVAVAYSSGQGGGYVVQIRELTGPAAQGPALVVTDGVNITQIALPGASMANTGHYLFHHNASATSALACASCHAEGHDDGHVWTFDTVGDRRTPTVSGGVLATAPLHWDGAMTDLTDIMHEVFERRMGGDPSLAGPRQVEAFAAWLDTIPAYPASPSGTPAQIDHGKQLFATSGCDGCHTGAHFTNNQTLDVGTGSPFQVPPLVGVAARAPFMHNGCAATLAARFDPTLASCNGGRATGDGRPQRERRERSGRLPRDFVNDPPAIAWKVPLRPDPGMLRPA